MALFRSHVGIGRSLNGVVIKRRGKAFQSASMRILSRRITVIILFMLLLEIKCDSKENGRSDPDGLSQEFTSFIKTLGESIFKPARRTKKVNAIAEKVTTIAPLWGSENQTANNSIIGDVLMLKLVSYYDDKYKIHPEEIANLEKEPKDDPDAKVEKPTVSAFEKLYAGINFDELLKLSDFPTKATKVIVNKIIPGDWRPNSSRKNNTNLSSMIHQPNKNFDQSGDLGLASSRMLRKIYY